MTLKAIPEKYHDLLKDETKAFLYLATVMDDGTPQNTPVWFNHDDRSSRCPAREHCKQSNRPRSKDHHAIVGRCTST